MADITAIKLPDKSVWNFKDSRVAVPVPANAEFTDTTYESKSAVSGGTAVSLVTTGEKYTWGNKADQSYVNAQIAILQAAIDDLRDRLGYPGVYSEEEEE